MGLVAGGVTAAGIGTAVAGGVASAAVGAGISALTKGSQSAAISEGQGQANAALQPFQTSGVQATTDLANLEGLNGPDAATAAMGNFTASPGYQYDVTQGLRGVDAGAASQGILRSGSTIKAEDTLSTNLADQDFGNYVTRLNTLAGYGSTAAGQQASTDTSAAGAQASILGAQGTNLSNAAGQAGGALTNGLTSYFNPNALPITPGPNAGSASNANAAATLNTSDWNIG